MIDTNIFIDSAIDKDSLSKDVINLIEDYDNTICMSAESLKELVVLFNNGGLVARHWKKAEDIIKAVKNEYYIDIIPVDEKVIATYSNLQLNKAQDHKDPSDHVIISHAITLGIPLISSDLKFPFYRNQGLDLIENKI